MANAEVTPGKAGNKPGLYRHPESGAEVFVTHHKKLGSAMADGVVAVGYQWVSSEKPEKKVEAKESPKEDKK